MFGTSGPGLVRFSLFGVPISIDWSFLIVPLFAWGSGWQSALVWTTVIFVSVLLHELGHAVAMKIFGFAPRVSIYALGGLTFWPERAAPTVQQSFVVSGAGPAVSITLGLLSLALFVSPISHPLARLAITDSLWVNLVWGVINLLPLMPLDGGNLLDTGASILTKVERPRWVGLVAAITGLLVIAGGLLAGQPFLAMIGFFSVLRGWSRWNNRQPNFDEALQQAVKLGWEGNREGAETILLMLRNVAATDEQRAKVAQELAWIHLMNGKPEAAEQEVRSLPAGWVIAPELRARLLATKDDVDGVISTLMPEVTGGRLPATAAPLLGSALVAKGRLQELEAVASLMLANARTREDPAGRAAADLTARLFHAGASDACLRMSEFLWKKFARGEDAFNSACSLAKLGRNDEAMRWLHDAARVGMVDLRKALESDDDVAALRARPDFAELLAKVQ